MKKRACEKCLSIILCSALVLSPTFATSENLVENDKSIRTEENSNRFSIVKKVCNKLKKKFFKISAIIASIA